VPTIHTPGHDSEFVASSAAASRTKVSSDPTLIDIVSALLRQRLFIARLVLFGALLGAIIGLLLPRTYTGDFSFTPQESGPQGGGLSAIASDFGLNIGSNAAQSPEFYENLIHTREVLWRLLGSKFTLPSATGSSSFVLLDSIVPAGPTYGVRRDRGTEALRKTIRARIDLKTSMVDVGITTWSPALAAQLCQRLIDEMNRFNSDTRRSRAAAQRAFAEQRVNETRAALRVAEDREEKWALQNKIYASSPELSFQKARYDREITLHDQEYSAAVLQFNAARMEEVRNIPVITIVERPVMPSRPDCSRWISGLCDRPVRWLPPADAPGVRCRSLGGVRGIL
jgi:uncharacterized protein involved in exopolysaccharide biosynthesis